MSGGGFIYDPIYRLIFTDANLDGMIVRARSCSLGQFLELLEKEVELPIHKMEDLGAEEQKAFCKIFAEYLVEWNIQYRDGSPRPATLEGLLSLDMRLIKFISAAWFIAIAGVNHPLDSPSKDGAEVIREQMMREMSQSQEEEDLKIPMHELGTPSHGN